MRGHVKIEHLKLFLFHPPFTRSIAASILQPPQQTVPGRNHPFAMGRHNIIRQYHF